MKRFFLNIILLQLLSGFSLVGQNPSHYRLTIEEELPDNKVYSIMQSRNGFIWIGTDAGLYKYDGVRYIRYNSSLQQARALTGLTESPNRNIYCYNFRGQVFYIQNDSLKLLKNFGERVSNIIADKNGNLWISHGAFLSVYNENKNDWVLPDTSRNNSSLADFGYVKSFSIAPDSSIWFINKTFVTRVSNNNIANYNVEFRKKENSVLGTYILCATGKTIWLISILNGDVYHLNGNQFKPYQSAFLKKSLKDKKVTNIKALSDGFLWITTYSGIIKYNPQTDSGQIFFSEYSFSDVIIDREGQYWFSSPNSGLFIAPDLNFYTYDNLMNDKPSQKLIKLSLHQNRLFFATESGQTGALSIDSGNISFFELENQSDIQALYFDPKDAIFYLFSNNFGYRLVGKKWERINFELPPVKKFIHLFGKYIIATSVGTYGFTSLSEGKNADTLTSNWSRDLQFDSLHNNLFTATNNGLVVHQCLSDSRFVFKKQLLDSIQVVSIDMEKSSGDLFVLTFDGRIYKIDSKLSVSLIVQLPSNIQGQQVRYYNDKLYLATNKGLVIITLMDNKLLHHDKISGLISNDVQAIEIHKNRLWLATGKGLQSIPTNISQIDVKPIVYLKKLFVNELEVDVNSNIIVRYNQSFKFNAEVISYRSQGDFRFAYRFENFDTAWHFVPSNVTSIEVPNLPAGKTIIEISAIDHWGRFAQKPIFLAITVVPPFWNRWWFYIVILLVAVGISTVGYLRRVAELRKSQRQTIEKIEIENELRLSQQAALKAQMNPHFIFNVLNSIKAFIYENDKTNAVKYLSSFSELVRNVLDMSSKQFVSLEDEIREAKLYIELESMLLDNDFTFNEDIDPSIDLNNVKIPSLLLQPFIENAFKHGLRHKTGHKSLFISIRLEDDNTKLFINITDNGIGRAASSKINESTKKHLSFATGAIEKRLNLLNAESEKYIYIETLDLTDEKSVPVGTSISIKIKLNEIRIAN
ncbi:MAG: histidine kinase [Tenuifilaceae bacterium]